MALNLEKQLLFVRKVKTDEHYVILSFIATILTMHSMAPTMITQSVTKSNSYRLGAHIDVGYRLGQCGYTRDMCACIADYSLLTGKSSEVIYPDCMTLTPTH